MIKKFRIPYNSLSKESILNLIITQEKNLKGNKFECSLLKHKTIRKKTLVKEKDNVYNEKIKKRVNPSNNKESKNRTNHTRLIKENQNVNIYSKTYYNNSDRRRKKVSFELSPSSKNKIK